MVRTDLAHVEIVKIMPYMSACKQIHNGSQAVVREEAIAYFFLNCMFFPLEARSILYIRLQSV